MALLVVVNCECGAPLQVYVPKRLAMGEWRTGVPEEYPGGAAEWYAELAAIDDEEEANGEVEGARMMCERLGLLYVDYRESEICPICGRDLPLGQLQGGSWGDGDA